MGWISRVVMIAWLGLSTAHAAPLEPHDIGGFTVSTPAGWAVTGANGTALAKQDPKRQDGAQLVVVVSRGNNLTEDQILDAFSAQALKSLSVVKRGPGPGNVGKVLVADGVVEGTAARLGAIAIARQDVAIVGVLVAKQSEFDGLGGTDLVIGVIATLKANAPAGDQVMTPQFDAYNAQIIPAPTRRLTLADLAGDWGSNGGASTTYVDSHTGTYAGHNSISIDQSWHIDASGKVTGRFKAGRATTTSVSGTDLDLEGTAAIDDRGLLVMTWKGHPRETYMIKGWFFGKDVVIMALHGPHYDQETITSEQIANPQYNLHQIHRWFRKR